MAGVSPGRGREEQPGHSWIQPQCPNLSSFAGVGGVARRGDSPCPGVTPGPITPVTELTTEAPQSPISLPTGFHYQLQRDGQRVASTVLISQEAALGVPWLQRGVALVSFYCASCNGT